MGPKRICTGIIVMLRATPAPGRKDPMLIWLTWYGSRPVSVDARVGEQYG